MDGYFNVFVDVLCVGDIIEVMVDVDGILVFVCICVIVVIVGFDVMVVEFF